jgi:RimJ/RimL family protein N-acetyltransferase
MLYGERVRLRRIEREDLPRFVAWLNDPELREHLTLFHPLSLPLEERWFADTLTAEPAAQPFSLEVRRAGASPGGDEWTHVGGGGFHAVDWRNRAAELGIFIGEKAFWGGGYGTDAVRTLARWAFDELNLNRVWLKVFDSNPRAVRCYEKVGFRTEGRLRQHEFRAGRYRDVLVMGLLRGELGAGMGGAR